MNGVPGRLMLVAVKERATSIVEVKDLRAE